MMELLKQMNSGIDPLEVKNSNRQLKEQQSRQYMNKATERGYLEYGGRGFNKNYTDGTG